MTEKTHRRAVDESHSEVHVLGGNSWICAAFGFFNLTERMFQVPRRLSGDLIVWLNGVHVFLLHTEYQNPNSTS